MKTSHTNRAALKWPEHERQIILKNPLGRATVAGFIEASAAIVTQFTMLRTYLRC